MTTTSHPTSFTILLFTQLARRLRQTNARYHHIAHQCRYARRPTHHAKRHALQAGLWVNTSKARAACTDNVSLSHTADPDASSRLLSALSAFVSDETRARNDPGKDRAYTDGVENGCMSGLGLTLRNLPEVVEQRQDSQELEAYSLPLFQGPVPGAPRWKSRPLPEEDVPVYEPAWAFRGAVAVPVHLFGLDSTMVDSTYYGDGSDANAHPLKRKAGKIANGVVDEGTRSESQLKRRRGL